MNHKTMLDGQIIIGVDFDGTITVNPDMTPFSQMELQPHAKRVLTWLKEVGDVRLVLWTCRTGSALDEAIQFLSSNDMLHLFEEINDQVREINEKYQPNVARKLGADFYIDDKNLGCVIDWLEIEKFLGNVLEKTSQSEYNTKEDGDNEFDS